MNKSGMSEEQRVLNEFSRYSITKLGVITNILTGHVLRPTLVIGYPRLVLYGNGKQKNRYVHRLVAQTFIPNPNNFPQVNHKNGIRTDNRVENLYWGTQQDNINDSKAHGTLIKGERAGNSKLKEFQVREIRLLKEKNPSLSCTEIGKMFGVTQSPILRILNNKTWTHVK